ncbi:GNAT family N-acetyltransferase [Emticicia sp. 17c]|uniref:GNAT family N-acetyltransferase n=1 Tax=Emticicia sp. 17c TaxID=3127704 RepID=UPI00301CFB49
MTEGHFIKPFDCDDEDLNDFLANDSKVYMRELLAVTYILESDAETVAFFSLANDKISLESEPNRDKTIWNRFKKHIFPKNNNKRKMRSFPAMKIGRLAVNKNYKGYGVGTLILDYLKKMFIDNNRTGCKFITVDAYRKSLGFYEKNQFRYLTDSDKDDDTRLMYFNLTDILNTE